MNLLIEMAAVGGILLVIAVAIANRRNRDAIAGDLNWTQTWLGLTTAFAIRMTALLFLIRNGQELMTMDEPIRWHIGYHWTEHPYFFTHWDGVWLPGQLAMSGVLGKLIHPPLISIQAGVFLCQLLTLAGMFYLCLVLTGRRWIGMLAVLITAMGYPLLWMGQGPLVETVIGGTFLLAMACLVRFVQIRTEKGRGGWCSLGLAALFIFATNALHYIGWMAVFIGMLFLVPLGLKHRRNIGRAFWPASILIAFSAAIVPALWIFYSWRVLGHPFQFYINTHVDQRIDINFGPQAASKIFRAMLYPKEITRQAGLLLPLIIGGVVIGGRGAAVRRWLFGFIATIGLIMEAQALAGNFTWIYFRSLILVYLLLIVFACVSIEPVFGALQGIFGARIRRLAWTGLVVLLAGWLGYNGLMANRYESHGEDMPHDTIALGKWLQQETRRPQDLQSFGPETRIGIYYESYTATPFTDQSKDYLAYSGGCPDRLASVSKKDFDEGRFNSFDYVFVFESDKAIPGGEMFNRIGRWRLYRIHKNTQPAKS